MAWDWDMRGKKSSFLGKKFGRFLSSFFLSASIKLKNNGVGEIL
jgi:hypothetical protein